MITGSPTPISGLPTGTIDNMQAIFPMDIGMPSLPQTIQASFLQMAQFLQSQGQMISGSYTLLDGRYQPTDGWISDENTWTFASADDPSYVARVNANVTGTIGLGTKIGITQHSTDKNFIATQVTLSGSNTYINMYGGTDYDLSSSGTITNPKYSYQKAPFGFPLRPDKWTVTATNTGNAEKTSPTSTTWYGGSGLSVTGISINAPIGAWLMSYLMTMDAQPASSGVMTSFSTLSTANNSESNPEYTVAVSRNPAVYERNFMQLAGRNLIVTAKTTWYLNIKTNTASAQLIAERGDLSPTTINLVCAYL